MTRIAGQQTTISRRVSKHGLGMHTGAPVAIRLLPAGPDTGIVFVTDSGVEIPACPSFVVDTRRATTLGRAGAEVRSVEHLCAALFGLGVDNVRVEVSGPEVPAADGSAREWVELIRRAGRRGLGVERRVGRLARPVWARADGSWAVALPAERLVVGVAVEYDDLAAGQQTLWLTLTEAAFVQGLAPARTFCGEEEYHALVAAGLARGGSLDNAFLMGRDSYSGPLRYPDEVVRHKALDLVGDIALCGRRLAAHLIAYRPSHSLNVRLAAEVASAMCATVA